jgi:peptide/nickel transport system substrate-binding protein
MVQALKAGEIDLAVFASADQQNALADTPHLDLLTVANRPTVMFLAFNLADPAHPQPGLDETGAPIDQGRHPIFGDPSVRQALILGWDHQGAVTTIIAGHGIPACTGVPPAIAWAYNPNLAPPPYDPQAAAALLDAAGWTDSDGDGVRDKGGVPLSFTLNTLQGHALWGPIARLAQSDWRAIGVEAHINAVGWDTLAEILLGQEQDVTLIGFDGGSPDPDRILRLLFTAENDVPGSGFNFTSYYNPELEALLDQGLRTPGCASADSAPIYYRIQEILYTDAPVDFIYSPYSLVAVHKRVDGWTPAAIWNLFYNVTDWTVTGAPTE